MAEPACLERARALKRHAKYTGMPLGDFCITLTKDEGFELLNWFRTTADPRTIDLNLLDEAIGQALELDNPFMVLKDFSLLGLDIIPREELH